MLPAPRDQPGNIILQFIKDEQRAAEAAKEQEKDGPKESIGITLLIHEAVEIDLEAICRLAWSLLVGATVSYTQNSQKRSKELDSAEATKITDNFFGKKFLGGCLDRILAVVRGGIHFDRAGKTLEKGSKAGVPDQFAIVLQELAVLSSREFNNRTDWIVRNMGLWRLGTEWQFIREGLSKPDGDDYQGLLTYAYDDGTPPPGNTASDHITAAKHRLSRDSNVDENKFEKYRDQAHLPLAVVEHFGMGALLFLPEANDPYRHINASRTALYDTFGFIKAADQDKILAQVARTGSGTRFVSYLWNDQNSEWD